MRQWPTPNARDWKTPDFEGGANYECKKEAGYTIDPNSHAANWATPTARDWKSEDGTQSPDHSPPLGRQVLQGTGPESPVGSTRHLNAAFVEWLMNFPPNWTLPNDTAPTDCEPSETPLSQRRPRSPCVPY
jgi:hypothetical protein